MTWQFKSVDNKKNSVCSWTPLKNIVATVQRMRHEVRLFIGITFCSIFGLLRIFHPKCMLLFNSFFSAMCSGRSSYLIKSRKRKKNHLYLFIFVSKMYIVHIIYFWSLYNSFFFLPYVNSPARPWRFSTAYISEMW